MIEKHFRLPNDNTSVDAGFSMSLDDLQELKASLTAVHMAVGEVTMEIPEIAKPSLSGRRSLYVVVDVKAGDSLTLDNVRSIRPCYGMKPKYLSSILGRKARRDIAAGERLSWDLIEGGKTRYDG